MTGGLFTEQTLGDGASVSPLLLLTKDATAGSRDVWLQTSFAISGEGGDQQSFINVSLGGVDPATGGLVGARRGGSSVNVTTLPCPGLQCGPTTTREAFAFTGDIASLAGPDGSHFLGKDEPNIVIGFDSTRTRNIGRDIPIRPNSSSVENQSGSTYHIGIGVDAGSQPEQTLSGQLNGYAAGALQSEIPSSEFINVVASTSPNDFNINFNKATNTLFANLTVHSDLPAEVITPPMPITLALATRQRRPTSLPISMTLIMPRSKLLALRR